MGPSVGAIRLMFQSLMASQPWLHDPDVLQLPWRKELEYDTDKGEAEPLVLSFGLMATDGVVSPHPPIQRALRTVAEALTGAGHEIMPWEPPSHDESSHIHPVFTNADGGVDVVEQIRLSGEPLVPQLHEYFANAPFPPLPLLDFYNLSLYLKDYRNRYSEYWLSTMNHSSTGRPVDAVILPVAPHAAVIPGKYYYYTYSSIVNVLDYTTVVIPVTTASAKIDLFDKDYKPLNEKDKLNWEAYDPEAYDGAPAAIQLMGHRLDEERLLSIAEILVKTLEDYRARKLVA
ncbi:hypothetical protein LTS15_008822 [Exophiala xenobiotica]|nr:hypothetical protein LTS15_008822 [Exophiala xenobiotica]